MKIADDSTLGKVVKAMGLNFKEMAAKIDVGYPQFLYMHKTTSFPVEVLHKLCFVTGKSFEELFPSPYAIKPQKIELNLAAAVSKPKAKRHSTTPKVQKEKPVVVTPPAAPSLELPSDYVDFSKINVPLAEDQTTQQATPPPAKGKAFIVEDIYDGGLPPPPSDM